MKRIVVGDDVLRNVNFGTRNARLSHAVGAPVHGKAIPSSRTASITSSVTRRTGVRCGPRGAGTSGGTAPETDSGGTGSSGHTGTRHYEVKNEKGKKCSIYRGGEVHFEISKAEPGKPDIGRVSVPHAPQATKGTPLQVGRKGDGV